jgi:hypothetical protein
LNTLQSLLATAQDISTKLDQVLAQGVPSPADQATIDQIATVLEGVDTKLTTILTPPTPAPAPAP